MKMGAKVLFTLVMLLTFCLGVLSNAPPDIRLLCIVVCIFSLFFLGLSFKKTPQQIAEANKKKQTEAKKKEQQKIAEEKKRKQQEDSKQAEAKKRQAKRDGGQESLVSETKIMEDNKDILIMRVIRKSKPINHSKT